ncbi:MAG: threonine synthase [Dehalococcoidia bacterium]|nr:threonine synthase [Dehalococcoidia bacterium]
MNSSSSRFILERYSKFLPITDQTPLLTLGEGGTPLVRSRTLENEIDAAAVYFKLELSNPTGSFKDRGMIMAVAKAYENGAKAVLCASTGNTSASASAYAAKFGLESYVIVPSGFIAMGKLAQAIVYGAKIVSIDGSFDDSLKIAISLVEKNNVTLVNSVNPNRIDGQKTGAFEIVDELQDAPDILCIPVGNAGNITAYWKGFNEYKDAKKIKNLPMMWGFQAAGAAPIVIDKKVDNPSTIATAIRIGNPASWDSAKIARDDSNGLIESVTDEEIIFAYQKIAKEEGIFAEPACAAPIAGLLKKKKEGYNFKDKKIVCIVTGSGLKDPDTALSIQSNKIDAIADPGEIAKILNWNY